MKTKIILTSALFLAFLFFANKSIAQDTTLQFGKILLYDIAASGTQAITVPANKVWRIESVSMGASGSAPAVFLKNSSNQNMAFFATPLVTASASFPFWLPEAFSGTFVNNNPSYRCSVSITEFTITP